MSKDCKHSQIERCLDDDENFTYQWRCISCRERFFHLYTQPGKIQFVPAPPPMATLRDQFAIAALAAIISRGDMDTEMDVMPFCQVAYTIAQAMMEARKEAEK